jgi:hypothetical protein
VGKKTRSAEMFNAVLNAQSMAVPLTTSCSPKNAMTPKKTFLKKTVTYAKPSINQSIQITLQQNH